MLRWAACGRVCQMMPRVGHIVRLEEGLLAEGVVVEVGDGAVSVLAAEVDPVAGLRLVDQGQPEVIFSVLVRLEP